MGYAGVGSRGRDAPRGRSTADAKAALRDEINRLCDGLNALLPQYWTWVEPTQYVEHRDELTSLGLRAQDRSLGVIELERLCRELNGLERAFQSALSSPQQRKMRKMFI